MRSFFLAAIAAKTMTERAITVPIVAVSNPAPVLDPLAGLEVNAGKGDFTGEYVDGVVTCVVVGEGGEEELEGEGVACGEA